MLPPKLDVRLHKFKSFVEFIQTKCLEEKQISAGTVVKLPKCPVKDEGTAQKYLDLMQKMGLHLKSKFTSGKVYFFGCTSEEDAAFKRIGFESWAGVKTEAFLRRHPLFGKFLGERVYRFLEYHDPLLPGLAQMFPSASEIARARLSNAKLLRRPL